MSRIPIVITDKNGKVIGTAATPEEAIKAKHIRLISRIVLKNNKGDFLLQKRASTMVAYPSCWDQSAAGHVDEGETPEEAAYRELKEELGLENITLKFIAEYVGEDVTDGWVSPTYNRVFIGEFDGDLSQLSLQEEEVDEVGWFDRDEIKRMLDRDENITSGMHQLFGQGII